MRSMRPGGVGIVLKGFTRCGIDFIQEGCLYFHCCFVVFKLMESTGLVDVTFGMARKQQERGIPREQNECRSRSLRNKGGITCGEPGPG